MNLLVTLPLAAVAAGETPPTCDVCEDVKLVSDAMEAAVRQHASAKNPLLLLSLSEKLGAVCRDHATRPIVVCEVGMPRTGEQWRLEVLPLDDVASQQPHRVSLTIRFPEARAEGVGEFRNMAFSDWRPDYLDPCRHSVWKLGPVAKTLSLASVEGHFSTSGCIDRVEAVRLYIFSSDWPFPAPRVY